MSNIGKVRDDITMTACGHCGAAVEPRDLTDIGCILCDALADDEPVEIPDDELDARMDAPTTRYDPVAVEKLLDEIARLQSDDDETPRATWDEGCDDAA